MYSISAPKSSEIINALRKKKKEYRRRLNKVILIVIFTFMVLGAISFVTSNALLFLSVCVIVFIFLDIAKEYYVDALYKHWIVKKRLNRRSIDDNIYFCFDEAPMSIFDTIISESKRKEMFYDAMVVIDDYCATGGEHIYKGGKHYPLSI